MQIRILVLLVFFLSGSALADPAVGRVESLHGNKKLYRIQSVSGKKYLSHIEQHAAIEDHFITDPESMASILFFLGGNISMGKGCEVEIVSDREAKVIRQGNYWVQFDPDRVKNEKKVVKIQTAGGVMGIRGTEFVVRVQGEGAEQTTELSLIEGEVYVETTDGQSYIAKSEDQESTRVRFGGGSEIIHTLLSRQELMGNLRQELGPEFEELRSSVRELRNALREQKLGTRTRRLDQAGWNLLARIEDRSGNIGDRNRAADRAIDLSGAQARQARIDALLDGTKGYDPDESTDSGEKDVLAALLRGEATYDVETIETDEFGAHPSMQWPGAPDQKFAVLILGRSDPEQVFWVDETVGPVFTHPQEAQPLSPGEYLFRVVPLGPDGQLIDEAVDYEIQVNE